MHILKHTKQVRSQLSEARKGGPVSNSFNPSTQSLLAHYLKHSSPSGKSGGAQSNVVAFPPKPTTAAASK